MIPGKKKIFSLFRTCFLIPAFLLISVGAFANIPVPALFGPGAPFFLSLKTAGLIFIAVCLVETLIFHFGLQISWNISFKSILIANIVSSFVGFLISFSPFYALSLLILPFVLIIYFRRSIKLSVWKSVAAGFIPAVCLFVWIGFSSGWVMSGWFLYLSLIPAFLLTLFIEFAVYAKILKSLTLKRIFRWLVLANVTSYLILAGFMRLFDYSPTKNPLLSYHYFHLSSKNYASKNEPAKSIEMFDAMFKFHERDKEKDDYFSSYLPRTLDTATILLKNGYREEAVYVIERIKETSTEDSYWSNVSKARLERLEKRLEEE